MATIRITRLPLDPIRRELLLRQGSLPDDFLSRAAEAQDYQEVAIDATTTAGTLMEQAVEQSQLRFKGERRMLHLMNGETTLLYRDPVGYQVFSDNGLYLLVNADGSKLAVSSEGDARNTAPSDMPEISIYDVPEVVAQTFAALLAP